MADIAHQFLQHYYTTFDTDRNQLVPSGLYRENSILTFSGGQGAGDPVVGPQAIATKLSELPFQKVEHNAKEIRVDVQPGPSGSIVILVTGELKVDDSPHPLPFSQAFQLSQDVAGQWFVVNDLFRLNV